MPSRHQEKENFGVPLSIALSRLGSRCPLLSFAFPPLAQPGQKDSRYHRSRAAPDRAFPRFYKVSSNSESDLVSAFLLKALILAIFSMFFPAFQSL